MILTMAEQARAVPPFVLARAVRLYPAYLASVAITALYVLPVGEYGLGTVLANPTMLQSFLDVPNITTPYLTLAFEISFYGLFARLVAVRAVHRAEAVALAWLALAALYRLAVPGPLGFDEARPLAQFGYIVVAPQFAPFFVLGMMVSRIHGGRLGTPGRFAVAAAIGLTLIGRGDFARIPGPAYAGAACLMAGALRLAAQVRTRGVLLRPLAWLGTVSYPLYLVHCTTANLCVAGLGAAGLSPALAVAASAPLSLALAAGLHLGLERPAMAAFRGGRFPALPEPARLSPSGVSPYGR